MPLFNKEGDYICEVCGDFWAAHSLGGNCNKLPMPPEQRATVEKLYSKVQRPPTNAEIMSLTRK